MKKELKRFYSKYGKLYKGASNYDYPDSERMLAHDYKRKKRIKLEE